MFRILIVDWGLDFGDGTSEIFANDDNVMFVSLYHQLFCSSSEANVSAEKIGKQNINISWKPSQNSVTDKDYIFAFFNVYISLVLIFKLFQTYCLFRFCYHWLIHFLPI